MSTILSRASRRYLQRHPWQIALSVLGVALGVAVVVAIELANQSAERAFRLSTEQVTGRTTHQLVAGPAGVDEDLYAQLRRSGEIDRAAPVVEAYVALPDHPGRVLHLVGVDPWAEAPFRTALAGGSVDPGELLVRPGAALVAEATARDLGLEEGGRLRLGIDGRTVEVELAGVLEGDPRGREDLLVMDIAGAQELLQRPGRLTRIDLILPTGTGTDQVLQRLREALPPGVEILEAQARQNATAGMIESFQLNLRALSLLALLCGTFLVYNTVSFSVVQRRPLIGRLRALGVTRRQIFRSILAEALALGLAGTVLGLLLGIGLGHALVRLVTRTINDLYFVLTVRELALAPQGLLVGIALGVGASLLAALAPAREATSTPPRQTLSRSALEQRARQRLPYLAGIGALLLAGGAALLVPRTSLVVAFTGMFVVVMGCALLAPPATAALMRLVQGPLGRWTGLLGRMAARGVVASLSRTGVAIAALTVAVSVTVGIGVMIDSFRSSVAQWLEHTLVADIYVSPLRPGRGVGGGQAPLPEELARQIAELPEVGRVNTLRRVTIASQQGPVQMAAVDLDERGRGSFRFLASEPEEAWRQVRQEEALLISEPFAFRRGLQPGDLLSLRTDAGRRDFPVAAVYRDYGSDQGSVLMDRGTYDRYWQDRGFTALAVFLAPGAAEDRALAGIRRLGASASASAGGNPGDGTEASQPETSQPETLARSNRSIRELSLEIFDRTFLITGVLRLLAGAVAFLGVVGALTALQLDRARELAMLRANGLTPRQVWRLVTAQTGLMGLAAGLLSIPMGVVMAVIMTHVINRRSFGWSVELLLPPSIGLEALALALVAALLAGIYPAYRMARTPPALALRQE
ncbi:MAG: ABC transporter permease [Acidobacteriota bacterium]|nr:ABC transporter permease [Acidobacteriota bacterium]